VQEAEAKNAAEFLHLLRAAAGTIRRAHRW